MSREKYERLKKKREEALGRFKRPQEAPRTPQGYTDKARAPGIDSRGA